MGTCEKCGGITREQFIGNKIIYICTKCGSESISQKILEKSPKISKVAKDIIKSENLFLTKKAIIISNLIEYRDHLELTQKDIANILGIKEQRYGMIERNSSTPSIATIMIIADMFKCSVDKLFKVKMIDKKLYDEIKYLKIDFTIDNDLKEKCKKREQEIRDLNPDVNFNKYTEYKIYIEDDRVLKKYFKSAKDLLFKQGVILLNKDYKELKRKKIL